MERIFFIIQKIIFILVHLSMFFLKLVKTLRMYFCFNYVFMVNFLCAIFLRSISPNMCIHSHSFVIEFFAWMWLSHHVKIVTIPWSNICYNFYISTPLTYEHTYVEVTTTKWFNYDIIFCMSIYITHIWMQR